MPSQLSPLSNNLLLKPAQPVDRRGAILIPEAHQTRLNAGEVLEKGPLCTKAIQVGDTVFYGAHSESVLKFGEHTFVVVAEENCLGKITKAKDQIPGGTFQPEDNSKVGNAGAGKPKCAHLHTKKVPGSLSERCTNYNEIVEK